MNRRAVIDAIHRHGRISRSDLAAELDLSPSAITAITAPFVEQGLVVEAELGTSTSVGRKPILLEIDYDFAYVIGVKVTNDAVVSALTNLKAEPCSVRSDRLDALDVASVVDAIAGAIPTLLAEARVDATRVLGVGVGLPGIVEHHTGTVRHSPLFGWYGEAFGDRLHDRVGLPVLVENDVDALTAAQAWFGHGAQHHGFLVLTLGRGVGLGIVIDGRVYRGPHGGVGEFGHTIVTPIEPRVLPAVAGTLESFLSDAALLERLSRHQGGPEAGHDPEALVRLADDGDPTTLDLLRDAGELLGIALANLVNTFAPSLIVLAGEGMRSGTHLLPHVRRALARYAFGDLAHRMELVIEAWGDDAWARGAAGVAAARFLQELSTPLSAVTSPQRNASATSLTHEGGSQPPRDLPHQP